MEENVEDIHAIGEALAQDMSFGGDNDEGELEAELEALGGEVTLEHWVKPNELPSEALRDNAIGDATLVPPAVTPPAVAVAGLVLPEVPTQVPQGGATFSDLD